MRFLSSFLITNPQTSDSEPFLFAVKNQNYYKQFWSLTAIIISFIVVWFSREIPFFWDNILQGSRCASFYYDTRFGLGLVLPSALDAGHPVLFPIWLAVCWLAFGKTLLVSHFAMWPAVFGVLYYSGLLAHRFLGKWWFLGLLLVLVDATLAAQLIQISPDLYLLFFYLLAINAIFDKQYLLLTCVLPFLGMISTRGSVSVFALLICAVWIWAYPLKFGTHSFWKTVLRIFAVFMPTFLIVVAWQIYHYKQTGWVGYNPNSEWAMNYQIVSFSGACRNAGILIFRLIDMGRLWILILIFYSIIRFIYIAVKNQTLNSYFSFSGLYKIIAPTKYNIIGLLILLLMPLLVWSPFFILYSNGTGHRYLLVCNLFAALAASRILVFYIKSGAVYVFSVLFLVGGWFWIYPDHIAKGWDATPAHLPYFGLMNQAKQKIKELGIENHHVASGFPALDAGLFTNLNQDTSSFVDYNTHTQAQYLLWSNIFNGFDDQMLVQIKNAKYYSPVWQKQDGFVRMVLYKKTRIDN